jgi:DNA-binding response OmpR family regulator
MRLLLVEDDELLGEGVQLALRRAGYAVDWLRDGATALQAMSDGGFDLAILDLGLPRLDGQAIINQLRARRVGSPILVLTARDRVSDRVAALDAGADDFLGKPFDPAELLARVRALLRRREGGSGLPSAVGDLVLYADSFEASIAGRRIELPRREFALLRVLADSAGRIVTRERLQQALYGWDDDVGSNALEVHVHHLRRKLGAERIRTVRGVGYALNLVDADVPP